MRTLRRAGFNPGVFMTRLGTAVPDAPDLNIRVGAEEPKAHPQSASCEDGARRIAAALDSAAIRARVGGIDLPRRAAA